MRRADVTPEWLTGILPVGEARVIGVREELWDGGIAVTSRVHRLRLEHDRRTITVEWERAVAAFRAMGGAEA